MSTLETIAKEIEKALNVKVTDIYEEEDLTDAGIEFTQDYSLQYAPYLEKPYILHHFDGEAQVVLLATKTAEELIAAVPSLSAEILWPRCAFVSNTIEEIKKAEADGKTILFKAHRDANYKSLSDFGLTSVESVLREYPHLGADRFKIADDIFGLKDAVNPLDESQKTSGPKIG